MMVAEPYRDPWWIVAIIFGCLVIAAVDVGIVPVFAQWWFQILYGGAALTLVTWWAWKSILSLEAFGALLITASLARAFVRTFAEDPRLSSAALNALVAIYTFTFVRHRQHPQGVVE